MKDSLSVGVSFGVTSGIITTLGLMIGLDAGTGSRLAVIGGILTIAIADAFSDALGVHISEESESKNAPHAVWESTLATFFSKLLFALTFVIPVLLFDLSVAIWISIGWGIISLGVLSGYVAKKQKRSPWNPIAEHVGIAIIVIVVAHYAGVLIRSFFGAS